VIPAAITALGPAWAWVLAGLVLMGGELLLPGIFLVWLGLAALLTGAVEAAFGPPWQVEVPLFAVLALALVAAASRLNRPRPPHLNRGAHRLIGREGVLDAPLADGQGRLRLDDTVWRVTGPDVAAGTRVRVTGVEGTRLLVDPV
jgi:inner membrane protein